MEFKVDHYSDEHHYLGSHGLVVNFTEILVELVDRMDGELNKFSTLKISNIVNIIESSNYTTETYMNTFEEIVKSNKNEGKVILVSLSTKGNDSSWSNYKGFPIGSGELLNPESRRALSVVKLARTVESENLNVRFSLADTEKITVDLLDLISKSESIANELINSIHSNEIYKVLTKYFVGLNPRIVYNIMDLRASAVMAINVAGSVLAYFINRTEGQMSDAFSQDAINGKYPNKDNDGAIEYLYALETFDINKQLNIRTNSKLNELFEKFYKHLEDAFKFVGAKTPHSISSDPLS